MTDVPASTPADTRVRPTWQAQLLGILVGGGAGFVLVRAIAAAGWQEPRVIVFVVAYFIYLLTTERLTAARRLQRDRITEIAGSACAVGVLYAVLLHHWS